MLIILEGPDGSGKSTLAQTLAAELGRTTSDKIEIWHRGRPSGHPLDEYLRPLYGYRPGTGHHLILDRWHWGEVVYPKILNRPTDQDAAVFWAIEAYLRRLGAVVVNCDNNFTFQYHDIYRERELDGTPDVWQITHLNRIRDEFSRMIYRSALPSLTYSYGHDPKPNIIDLAHHYETQARELNDFVTYSGPAKPHTLLLGDVRNLQPVDPLSSPAFVPTKSSSGHYLLKSLTSLMSRQWVHGVGLANVNDVDNVYKLWQTLGKPAVVTLGRKAYARALYTLNEKYSVIPHPQYVRRFHHQKSEQYGWLIYRASQTREDYSKWPLSSTPTTDEPPTLTSSPSSGSSASTDRAATAPPAT
jgi:hypothetical protein